MSERKTLSELSHEAVQLAGLCDGLDVLADTATRLPWPEDLPRNCDVRRAANSLPPLIDTIIRRTNALADDLERLEHAGQRTVR